MNEIDVKFVEAFSKLELPVGFIYPESFLKLVGVLPAEFYYPWYFMRPGADASRLIRETIDSWSQRNLVPFARYDAQDAYTACFDGEDRSGNPQIFEVDFVDKCVVRRMPNFDVWEREARAEAETWTVNEYLYKGD